MLILPLHKTNQSSVLVFVAKKVRAGATVVYPTDTSYALGCDALNAKAVRRIFAIKKRDTGKPLPIIAADAKQVKMVVQTVGDAYMRPLLTIILSAKKSVPRVLHAGTNEVAVRVPANDSARELARRVGHPLVSTSANIAGAGDAFDARAIARVFARQKARPDVIIDAGVLPKSKPSTIVRVGKDGVVEVVRDGAVTIDEK